jgi:broad specificity phosphatase PhoE
MRPLYIIRHATPQIRPDQPARDWTLSERGAAEAQALARVAAKWKLQALYCSSEPKARATALVVGDALSLGVAVVDGFDELHMPEWIGNSDEFNELVRALLEDRGEGHRGSEAAAVAARRFAGGVRIVEQGAFPAAVVSHGRVITAWLSEIGALEDPYAFWRAIPMPGWVRVDLDATPARWQPRFSS